ncbi:MAG: class I SAM-dependent methyltransferase [Pseudomonadota bacterium]
MRYLIEFFAELELLAPADPESTQRAIECVPVGVESTVIDAGCGTGRQTLQLLETTPSVVTAIDLEEQLLKPLISKARERGYSRRLKAVAGDMLALPCEHCTVDLIYAEGSVYTVGVKNALTAWKPYLKDGGYICFSDAAYTAESPPPQVKEFWESEYPRIGNAEQLRESAGSLGYQVIDAFWMPQQSWDDYYGPVADRIADLSASWSKNSAAAAVLQGLQKEVDLHREHGDTYGYYFLVLQNREGSDDD